MICGKQTAHSIPHGSGVYHNLHQLVVKYLDVMSSCDIDNTDVNRESPRD